MFLTDTKKVFVQLLLAIADSEIYLEKKRQ